MTILAKLGSSIVADDAGELRADVLDRVCAQVADLHRGGEEIALVTSGAIARGMRLLALPARPRDVDEMQAATGITAAQVLLTSFDMSIRMHYLNAHQTLRRLIAWRAVPVINENDTTA